MKTPTRRTTTEVICGTDLDDTHACRLLKRIIDGQDEVARRNTAEPEGSGVCHTHDFCDANVCMESAFTTLFGRSPLTTGGEGVGLMSAEMLGLWEAAWAEAKRRGFAA